MQKSLVALFLLTLPAAADAQDRKAQAATGASLAALGIYAALADRDCPYKTPSTIIVSGRCYAGRWTGSGRVPREGDPGDPLEIPKLQLAGGIIVAGVGGMMAGGVWEPSRVVDAFTSAGLGVALVAGAFDYRRAPGTVTADFGGETFTACNRNGRITDRCTDAPLERRHMLLAGLGAIGVGAIRWFWTPDVRLAVTPSGVRASKSFNW